MKKKQIAEDSNKVYIHHSPVYMFAKDQTSVPDKTRSLMWPHCRWSSLSVYRALLNEVLSSPMKASCIYSIWSLVLSLTSISSFLDLTKLGANSLKLPLKKVMHSSQLDEQQTNGLI